MKKSRPFDEAKPRTPRGEARQREIEAASAIEDLLRLHDEGAFLQRLAEHYGIMPGHPRYDRIIAIWREYQRERP
jgi:hypothetical protein